MAIGFGIRFQPGETNGQCLGRSFKRNGRAAVVRDCRHCPPQCEDTLVTDDRFDTDLNAGQPVALRREPGCRPSTAFGFLQPCAQHLAVDLADGRFFGTSPMKMTLCGFL